LGILVSSVLLVISCVKKGQWGLGEGAQGLKMGPLTPQAWGQ
jgi:hypothetical protein